MAIYLMSYDLRQPGRDYSSLYKALAKVDCVRALESVWLLDVTQSASQLREAVRSYMDSNDRVLVIEITEDAAWAYANLKGASGAWLKRKRP